MVQEQGQNVERIGKCVTYTYQVRYVLYRKVYRESS